VRVNARQLASKKQTTIEAEFLLDYVFTTQTHVIMYVLLQKYQFLAGVVSIRLDCG
jgi:hypothetical protein